jgi:hypothetical protein
MLEQKRMHSSVRQSQETPSRFLEGWHERCALSA